MRAVVQRVKEASVTVDNKTVGAIDKGLVVFLGVEDGDTEKDTEYMADKIANLRIFEDESDKMNLSLKDISGQILVISQFTLFGDVRKGKRPSFVTATKPESAKFHYEKFINLIEKTDIRIEKGIFQADMLVKIYNDGPVTILIDSKKKF